MFSDAFHRTSRSRFLVRLWVTVPLFLPLARESVCDASCTHGGKDACRRPLVTLEKVLQSPLG